MAIFRLEIETRPDLTDALAIRTSARLDAWLAMAPAQLRTRRVFHVDVMHEDGRPLSEEDSRAVLEALVDPVAEVGSVGMLEDPPFESGVALAVGFRPGVTDTVGATVRLAIADALGGGVEGHVYSSILYLFDGLREAEVQRAAAELLHNPLIERATIAPFPRALDLSVPTAGSEATPTVRPVALRELDEAALLKLSKDGMLALSLEEMRAIQSHFQGLGRDPNDAELECLAQTWSEHCKHKIFASAIDYEGPDGSRKHLEKGLFRTYVRGATEAVAQQREAAGADAEGAPFLVSVFHDNAGVVRFTERDHLAYKVETHNSPSALDPYGGAMTGIVGVNRDSFGTGRGADLLTNVWGYCLGDPRHEGALPKGLMHPRRIRDGVHDGVIDGGNHSGIPYSRGFELFDDRYAGKPLVYCGTVSVMPAVCAGVPTHEKPVEVGDAIVMLGGRIGKDGIHGATFSSVELDEDSPVQAVQIGDPITQRMMFDMLAEA
ncbi:MAG: AIR synthase related protein, partial [Nannocystaceae bacterium]